MKRNALLPVLFATVFLCASCSKDSGLPGSETIDLSGTWKMDMTLGSGQCDETILEDEEHIPPTFHFNNDSTITFDTDPVESDLNEHSTSNYQLAEGKLYISLNYDDGTDRFHYSATLAYNESEKKFTGTYIYNWPGSNDCTNSVIVTK